MSNIFDALQRSEAERSGVDFSALSAATDLLQRAERRAVSKWETGTLPPERDTREAVEEGRPFGPHEVLTTVTTPETSPAAVEPLPAQGHPEIFSQFQSLQVPLSLESRLVCLTDKDSPAAEAFRLLGVRLRHFRRDFPLKKLLITSTIPQEGKSLIAANLACALSFLPQSRTLLLEGDLRRPSLSQKFGLEKVPGLCEWLQGERSLKSSIYHLEGADLWILPAGGATGKPLELLQSGKLTKLMDQLTAWFDWIIVDSPPVLPVADMSVLERLVDGILLVTRQGTTEKRQLQRGLEALGSKKLIGALVNSSESSTYSDYYYRLQTDLRPTDSPTE